VGTSLATNHHSFLRGGGELGALMRAKDWSAHPLGPPESWSQSIRAAVSVCLNSRFPILLWIGPELRILYNDAYVPFLGPTKHPDMLGAPGREAWGEIWQVIGPMHDEVRAGRSTWVEDFQMFFARLLPSEEVYITFSYGPILSDDGTAIEGTFCACTETSGLVVGERRLATLRRLGLRGSEQTSVEAACRDAASVLDDNPFDFPFAAIYLLNADGDAADLVAKTRLTQDRDAFPPRHALVGEALPQPWPLAQALRSGDAIEVPNLSDRIGAFQTPLWPDLVETAFVLPLSAHSLSATTGFLILGISPRRVLDASYRGFLDLVAEHIATAIAGARAFEDERRRAEALVQLDRAKVTFFSNVSHEFRTPLTLMLSPLEEMLAKPEHELSPDGRALATVAHRNSLRLLKLVNTLLDFSRNEAGRIQALYEPTDLARLTAELSSNFRSACDSAGLRLVIACEPLPEPVYVDRDMWEKIVLNLISNAFKFTFEGGIDIRVRATPVGAELSVSDTGVGIPATELPRLFERFHRVEGQRSRSHEGSGIGLAFVQDLVSLHGGTITVGSEDGRGTAFTIVMPFGMSHLPADRIGAARTASSTSTRATAFVEEALSWLPTGGRHEELAQGGGAEDVAPATEVGRILLADDNADMREYLWRLLSRRGWKVETVVDGESAISAARSHRPDIVISDVMMPGLSGLELAAALRREPKLADVPVILLSARAGEGARVEGLESGADDYLVKPFAARELLAKINSQQALARQRREAAERVRRSESRLKAAVDLVGVVPYTWDPVTNAVEWDDRLRAMWGLKPGAPVDYKVFLAGLHLEDRPRVEAAIEACLDPAGDGIYATEYRVIGADDGVERWVSTYGQTIFEDGRAVAFVGAALDITASKQANQQLRDSEERFRKFAEHSGDVLWIRNLEEARIEYLSPAFEAIWGEPSGAFIGDPARWAQTIHRDDRTRIMNALDRVVLGETVTQEYRIIRPDGSVRWIRHTSFPIPDERGRVRRSGGIAQDVTRHDTSVVYVVDADDASRQDLVLLLQGAGYDVKAFASARTFLGMASALMAGCVVMDIASPTTVEITLPQELKARGVSLPVIVVGAPNDVGLAVRAMKTGAADWLEKPYGASEMLASVASAMAAIRGAMETDSALRQAQARIAGMSAREREVLQGLLAGGTNKTIARILGISPRTVELHRAHVMERLGARNLPEAVLIAAAAGLKP
jgi:PAS domain S-box-containing protein